MSKHEKIIEKEQQKIFEEINNKLFTEMAAWILFIIRGASDIFDNLPNEEERRKYVSHNKYYLKFPNEDGHNNVLLQEAYDKAYQIHVTSCAKKFNIHEKIIVPDNTSIMSHILKNYF